ncbi:hypothetical protein J6590_013677 [Homalodisca vitripennis]|nr:hypothetical protein J6590_013677 [Homalodisca vitripennis]
MSRVAGKGGTYTISFMKHQKKISSGVRSGERRAIQLAHHGQSIDLGSGHLENPGRQTDSVVVRHLA